MLQRTRKYRSISSSVEVVFVQGTHHLADTIFSGHFEGKVATILYTRVSTAERPSTTSLLAPAPPVSRSMRWLPTTVCQVFEHASRRATSGATPVRQATGRRRSRDPLG